jgi:hypothetical protein
VSNYIKSISLLLISQRQKAKRIQQLQAHFSSVENFKARRALSGLLNYLLIKKKLLKIAYLDWAMLADRQIFSENKAYHFVVSKKVYFSIGATYVILMS